MNTEFDEVQLLDTLLTLCDDLAWGRPADADKLYQLTSPDAGPERFVRLAEAFGLMLVKVEGREFAYVRLVEQLEARNSELEQARNALAERNALLLSNMRDAFKADNMVARCPAMRRVVDMALSIARRPINTLILGPTGAGKEVIAKIIHNHSPRSDGPFVAVNCTAIPDSLFESEMFGIEKGVATGVSARKGLVEEAHGGTLFLDELAEMTLPNQAKLLRVLEEHEVQRVGSAKAVPVDIKTIAATNVSLDEAVRQGRFREDLYYRINVVEIQLPPLRERGDDVLLLAQNFLLQHCKALGRERMSLSPRVREILSAYAWPGNVRELNNEMERATALTTGNTVEEADLSPRILGQTAIPPTAPTPPVQMDLPAPLKTEPAFPPVTGSLRLEEMEKACLLKALERTGGNRSRAAVLLGLTREGLRKKMLRMKL